MLRVSQRFVEEQAGAPILLGRREVITRMAEMNGISLKFVRIIEPEKSSDLQMFCDRYERAEQMFGNGLPMNTREIVSEPVHFAAMMVLYLSLIHIWTFHRRKPSSAWSPPFSC